MVEAVKLLTRLFASITLMPLLAVPEVALAEEACYECHGDEDFGRDDGPEGGLFVDAKKFGKSVHADVGCSDCHQDATLVDDEHKPKLAPVDCGECHEEVAEKYGASLHGKALARGDKDAPTCASCHGEHDILAVFCLSWKWTVGMKR